jgi:adenine C2-methylase RlmN of 23S rRNA A2503 and tRNA A37
MEDVFPMLVTVGRASGHRVTLNIPMIVGHTDTLQNMERTALYVKPYSDAMRIKLSSFNPSYDADGGAEHLEPSSAEHVRECAEYLRQQKLEVKIFTADTQSDGSKIEAGCGRLNIMTRAKIGSAMS